MNIFKENGRYYLGLKVCLYSTASFAVLGRLVGYSAIPKACLCASGDLARLQLSSSGMGGFAQTS